VTHILDEVPPHLVPDQLVAEARRAAGVPVALYVIDIDGSQLIRLAGSEDFPSELDAPPALGPEIVPEGLPSFHARLRELLPSTTLHGTDRVVESLREVKDDDEIDALARACDISTRALEQLLEGPLVGRTEREVARDLENRMYSLGAEAIAFETILATGDHTAVPHHHPTDRVLVEGDLLKIDFGARVDGYHADCTRTVVLGRADDWQREVYAAVRESQAAGLDLLRAGVDVSASDVAARASLGASGWLDAFTTGLGHGVGLEIHEDPFIAGSHAGKLSSRTVLTMEPGIYVPGRGGVRIEDTVLVTAGAPEVLTTMTKDLLEIG
jgi:Xaa-Pro aminopeptidase